MGPRVLIRGLFLTGYKSGKGQIKETTQEKLGQSCLQCNRVVVVVEVVGSGGRACSWVRSVIKFPEDASTDDSFQ
jgi:hypothetical protein